MSMTNLPFLTKDTGLHDMPAGGSAYQPVVERDSIGLQPWQRAVVAWSTGVCWVTLAVTPR